MNRGDRKDKNLQGKGQQQRKLHVGSESKIDIIGTDIVESRRQTVAIKFDAML